MGDDTSHTQIRTTREAIWAAILAERARQAELKASYYRQAVKNLAALGGPRDEQESLFG